MSLLYTGAYFVWIIYALGAGFVQTPEIPARARTMSTLCILYANHFGQAYFARALKYLHAVLRPQNLTTVQGLLAMCQYYARAVVGCFLVSCLGTLSRLTMKKGGPSLW